jgi:hypothetical protein
LCYCNRAGAAGVTLAMPYQFTKALLWQDPFLYRPCWCDLPSASHDNARQKVFFTDADRELSPENFIYLVNTGNYAQSFNRRHNRVGHLSKVGLRRFWWKGNPLLELCRHIVLNPLRVKGSVRIQIRSGAVTAKGWTERSAEVLSINCYAPIRQDTETRAEQYPELLGRSGESADYNHLTFVVVCD